MSSPGFEFHEVFERLTVGPCPNTPERIRAVKQAGYTAVVSVQTDEDLTELGLSWPLLWKFLVGQGLSCQRVPIRDFDQKALARGLEEAVAAVNDLHRSGHRVYLHCTAGVNRSPSVAIAWLMAHQQMELEVAWELVTARRPSAPHRSAIEAWKETRK
jgi:hypothetical protein